MEKIEPISYRTSIDELFESHLPRNLERRPEKLGGQDITIQFEISGEGGGSWNLKTTGGRVEVSKGVTAGPDVTLYIRSDDWRSMMSKKLDIQMAFMSGKLRVGGDRNLAMRLGTWIHG